MSSGSSPTSPLRIKAGRGYFGDPNDWGDYSWTSLDPEDSVTIWTVQEYAETSSDELPTWGTYVAAIALEATSWPWLTQ